MPRARIAVVVQLRLLPDCIEPGMRELLDFSRSVERFEPECSSIEIIQNADNPTQVTMIEAWSNRDVYEGPHMQTPHMRAFIDRAGKYFDGPAGISFGRSTTVFRDELRRTAPYGR